MPAATIPMSGDLAEVIGQSAEKVENRSLLIDKFAFHKKWPVVEETSRRGREVVKWDEATRWSFMRIADGADKLLRKEAAAKRYKANGRDVEPENRVRFEAEAKIAESLANTKWNTQELSELRANHTRRLLTLFRSAYGERAAVTIGQLEGRLAINLANSLIQNAGICLDRLFGLPYIPGSAVKGISRHTALEELAQAKGDERAKLFRLFTSVFGTAVNDFEPAKPAKRAGDKDKPAGSLFSYLDLTKSFDQKGAVSFLPAYPINQNTKIVVDLTNVHYPDYYRSGKESDLKNENPRPNPFPAVEVGAQFAFCLVLNGINNDPELLAAASRWLESAITIHGIGAKTASGYGWFSLKPEVLEIMEAQQRKAEEEMSKKQAQERAAVDAAEAEASRKAALSPEAAETEAILSLVEEEFAKFAKELASKSELQQHAFLAILTQSKEKRERWKTWKRRKPDLAAIIQQTALKINFTSLP